MPPVDPKSLYQSVVVGFVWTFWRAPQLMRIANGPAMVTKCHTFEVWTKSKKNKNKSANNENPNTVTGMHKGEMLVSLTRKSTQRIKMMWERTTSCCESQTFVNGQ